VKKGEVLIEMNGRPLFSVDHYIMRLASRAIGSNVAYAIRDTKGTSRIIKITIAALPHHVEKSWRITGTSIPLAGAVVVERRYPFSVFIVAVEPNSNASRSGFQPGDRILGISHMPIKTMDDLKVCV
jgi:S1-C subfamily serine protease